MSITAPTSTVTPEQMDAVVNAHFAAEEAHDMNGLLATLTDDCDQYVVGFEPHRGHDEIRSFYEPSGRSSSRRTSSRCAATTARTFSWTRFYIPAWRTALSSASRVAAGVSASACSTWTSCETVE